MPYKIINWGKYQVRNDRKHNPWIKLDKNILTSGDFFGLPVERRWEWFLLLCLAEHATGVIDESDKNISFKLRYPDGKTFDPKPFLDTMLQEVVSNGDQWLPLVTTGCLEEEEEEEERREEDKPQGAKNRTPSVSEENEEKPHFDQVWALWRSYGWSGRRKAEGAKRFAELRKRQPGTPWVVVFERAFQRQDDGLKLQKRIEGWAPRQPDLCVWIEDKRGGVGERWKDEPYIPPKIERKPEPHEDGRSTPSLGAPDEEWLKYFGTGTMEDVEIWRAEKQKITVEEYREMKRKKIKA